MARPDVSDGELAEVLNQVKDDKSDLDWVVFGYAPKSVKVRVDAKGKGGMRNMLDEMSDGKVHFCFIRYDLNGLFKFVYVAWCGEGVAGMVRGTFAQHATFMERFLNGYHVQINARTEDDCNEADILNKLKAAAGSHGRRNVKARVQGGESEAGDSVADAGKTWGANKADAGSFESTPQSHGSDYADKSTSGQSSQASSGGAKSRFEQAVSQSNEPAPRAAPAKPAPVAKPAPAAQPAAAPPAAKPAPAKPAPPPSKPAPPPSKPAPPPSKPAPVEETYDDSGFGEEEAYEEEAAGYGAEEEAYGGEEEAYGGEEEEAYEEEAAPNMGTCVALYDFPGENEGDLVFSAGDTITLLDDSDPSGWWFGEFNGVQGNFPMNFVERS